MSYSSTLVVMSMPSREHQELEKMARQFRGLASLAVTAATFQGPSSADINAIVAQDFFAEHHLSGCSSISGPCYLSIRSAINLLNNPDIATEAERFIREFHPPCICLIKGAKKSAASSDEHQSLWQSHRAASSMSTSFNKDGSIHINVKYD